MQSLKLLQLIRRPLRRNYSNWPEDMTTLNDLPSPNGSWKLHYGAHQNRYNRQLLGGVGFLLATIGFGKAAGLFEFWADIPERPADIERYKDMPEDCECT